MKTAIGANPGLQEILKDTLLSVQKTNEFIVSLVAALNEAPEPAPAVTRQNPPKENMNIWEAAEYCGYSKSYLYQLVHRKEIPRYKPSGGRIFFKRKELDDFISRGKQDAGYEIADEADAVLNGEQRGTV
jgi:excisionase family DNA binding protein